MKKRIVLAALIMACTMAFGCAKQMTIGTGGVRGVYFPTGRAIASLVNKKENEHGMRLTVASTGGSVYNLKAIRSGIFEMAMAQSDWLYHAYHGTKIFRGQGPNKDLRAVFSVHPEPFVVVARADSAIKNFLDLKGKRVNIGNPGSSQRKVMEIVMEAMGWTVNDFKLASELKWAEQSQALCDNKVDAIIYMVGNPNGSVQHATTTCDSVLVNVTGKVIDTLIAENDYYRTAVIPGGMYRGNPDDVNTFGVGATFVSSARVPEHIIYSVVKSVFENFDEFKKLHPAFAYLKKEEMVKDGLSAPLHDGAVKYYKEVGLIR